MRIHKYHSDTLRHTYIIPDICHPRHPQRQCKKFKVRGIFSTMNEKGTLCNLANYVYLYTQCVILHTVCNFVHNVLFHKQCGILYTVCNFTHSVEFYTQCGILHTMYNFVHSE